jgi:hypothetical protein
VDSVSSRELDLGGTVTVTGHASSSLCGKSVVLQLGAGGTWADIASASPAGSRCEFTLAAAVNTSGKGLGLRVYTPTVPLDGIGEAVTDTGTIDVAPAQSTQSLSVTSVSSRSIDAGQAITVTGSASAGLAGKTVALQSDETDGWTSIGTATVAANGSYSVTGATNIPGRARNIRVHSDGDRWSGVGSATAGAGSVDVYTWYYLSDMKQVEGSATTGGWRVNGELLGNSVRFRMAPSNSIGGLRLGESHITGFDIARKCTDLRTTIGLDDGSTSGTALQAKAEILTDSVVAWTKDPITFGTSTVVNLPISNTLRLKLRATQVMSGTAYNDFLIFGDARVRCAN